jgi:predicted DNA-binding protein
MMDTRLKRYKIMNKQITIRCSGDLYETLTNVSKHYEIKKSKLIRMILEEYQLKISDVFPREKKHEAIG